jgi:hypothetical protein
MARFGPSKKTGKVERRPDGHVRQSQLVGAYGAGSMIDLVQHAVVVCGLDSWDASLGVDPIDEPRLRDRLAERYKLDLDSRDYFRRPPPGDDREPNLHQGIRVLEFPAWFVCQGCRRLVHRRDLSDSTRRDGRRYHECDRDKKSVTVPVRFVGACANGHLQDFPWLEFAHFGVERCAAPELYLDEGRTGDFFEIFVICASCGHRMPLATALAKTFSLSCDGLRPWLPRDREREQCKEDLRLLVRTASNGYFSMVISALSVPDPTNELFDDVRHIETSLKGLQGDALRVILQQGEAYRPLVEKYGVEPVIDALEQHWQGLRPERLPTRTAEYQQLTKAPDEQTGEDFGEDEQFVARRIEVPQAFRDEVSRVVLAHRLREVRVQYGFSRLEPASQDNQGEYDIHVRRAPLSSGLGWLPAATIQGEGVFLELAPKAIAEWSNRAAVIDRAKMLNDGFQRWYERNVRARDDGKIKVPPFLGARFYLLHSLSHLLINAISLECGYAASSIRERIYCGPYGDDHTEMSGILLYTGTPGSEGTLGGLVEQGRRLEHHLRFALEMATLCSNDPVCGSHKPKDDPTERWLEGAACHACLFVAEPSCERYNRYLDRALVVPVIGEDPNLAFFEAI